MNQLKTRFLFIVILLLSQPVSSLGQGLGMGGGGSNGRIEGKYKILPVPYMNYDRSLGFSIGALPMMQFNPVKKDTVSPSSTVGLLGVYTTNDTWFGMGFGVFYFNRDNWRLTTAGGLGSVNFQFYLDNPVSGWIPYNTAIDFFMVKVQRRIIKKLYGGISYVYLNFNTSTENAALEFATSLHGLGANLSFDQRDNVYYPHRGYFTNLEYYTYPEFLGNEVSSDKIEFDYSHYFPFRKNNDVLAARFFSGIGIGQLSFNQQFIVGQTDIRGYTQGAFRGNNLITLQGEYRWNFYHRLGAVGFFGLATMTDAINEADNGKILPGIGTGFRYTLSKDTQFKVGVDVAAGIDDWGIYFRIGESF